MPQLDQYTYVFAIGTFFAMLDAYNNGANDGYVSGTEYTTLLKPC